MLKHLREGAVIPAHPLALNRRRKLDERRQRALTRYYIAAGAGGVAVGVHTTQFAIHDPKVGLLRPVLELAAETLDRHAPKKGPRMIRVAGIRGTTRQAVREAAMAAELGYHAGLLNLGGLDRLSPRKLIEHVRAVAETIPVFGFYLQPAMGGLALPHAFWREFVEIDNVVAIKIAAFNRYQTLDVVRAVAESGRASEIALYTGNDDNIVGDLLTNFRFEQGRQSAVAANRRRPVGPLGFLDTPRRRLLDGVPPHRGATKGSRTAAHDDAQRPSHRRQRRGLRCSP